jgi:hypothetical protein
MARRFAKIIGAISTVVAFGAEVGPGDMVSNLSQWIEFIGIKSVPWWLASLEADRYATFIGVAVALICLFIIFYPRISKLRSRKEIDVSLPKSRPLKAVGIAEKSQICFFGQYDLEVQIAVQFENSESNSRFIKAFRIYVAKNGARQRIENSPTVLDSERTKICLDKGLVIQPGISALHYISFNIEPFVKENQTFEVEMEAVGQITQRMKIIPEWQFVVWNQLAKDTVREIRDLT